MRKLKFGDMFKVCQGICEAHQLDNLKRVRKGFIFKDQVENYKGKHRHLSSLQKVPILELRNQRRIQDHQNLKKKAMWDEPPERNSGH